MNNTPEEVGNIQRKGFLWLATIGKPLLKICSNAKGSGFDAHIVRLSLGGYWVVITRKHCVPTG